MNQTQIRYILAAGWGIYAGVGLGYLIGRRTWKRIADKEIESVKDQYAKRQEAVWRGVVVDNLKEYKKELSDSDRKITKENLDKLQATPEEEELISRYGGEEKQESIERDETLARESQAIAEDLKYYDLDTIDPEEVEPNVKFSPDDFPEEVPPNRRFADTDPEDPSRPYVISVDEFMDDEPDYSKTTLMYYEGDDILADEKDRVIRSLDKLIGDDAVTQFGQRSGDNNLVYVRNERMEADYEICREERSYQEVALNMRPPKSKRGVRFEEDSDE